MNVVKNYIDEVTSIYRRLHPDIDPAIIEQHASDIIQRTFSDIPCTMKNNITHENRETTVSNVFEWIDERQPIITGNGAFFMQHSEYLAPTVTMLESLKANRSKVKKKMYTFKKGSIEYINLDTSQGNIKVIMNSDYGGSGTPLSPFYSVYIPPATTGSAKNITTTLICCLEFLSHNNNQWAKIKNINGLFDMMTIILSDTEERDLIKDSYSAEVVTNELLSRLITWTPADKDILYKYVNALSNDERTKIMLAFNIHMVIEKYLSADMITLSNYMKQHQLDVDNITEEGLSVAGFGVKAPEELQSVFDHVNKVILDNCCYPFILDDAESRATEMIREIVCVTDTDSLMLHFAHYVDSFQTRVSEFRDSCLMATAIGVRIFVENVIPRMVGYVANGCNIKDKYYRDKFRFKNEFGFLAMALFAKKMYASSCFVQEGNPRDIHKMAISGMSFKKRDAAEFLAPVMVDLYDKNILTVRRIHVDSLLDKYYELRQLLSDNLKQNTKFYQVAGLKTVAAYDAKKVLPDAMRGALIWNMMFPDDEMHPMDRVIVIKLDWNKLESLANTDARINQLFSFNKILYIDHGALAQGWQDRNGPVIDNETMKHSPVICLPEGTIDVPEWMRECIDEEGTIDKLLSPFKQLLGLFDVYMAETKTGMIASRMVCI